MEGRRNGDWNGETLRRQRRTVIVMKMYSGSNCRGKIMLGGDRTKGIRKKPVLEV